MSDWLLVVRIHTKRRCSWLCFALMWLILFLYSITPKLASLWFSSLNWWNFQIFTLPESLIIILTISPCRMTLISSINNCISKRCYFICLFSFPRISKLLIIDWFHLIYCLWYNIFYFSKTSTPFMNRFIITWITFF